MNAEHQPEIGDEVLIRAKVTGVLGADRGYTVELFSKTDQYGAAIRPDLVAEVIPAPAPLAPEPPVGAIVFGTTGNGDSYLLTRTSERDESGRGGIWAILAGDSLYSGLSWLAVCQTMGAPTRMYRADDPDIRLVAEWAEDTHPSHNDDVCRAARRLLGLPVDGDS